MKKINNAADLDKAIAELEQKAALQKKDIQETFATVSENLKPMNLVKSGFRSVLNTGTKEDILNVLLGVGFGLPGPETFIGENKGSGWKNRRPGNSMGCDRADFQKCRSH